MTGLTLNCRVVEYINHRLCGSRINLCSVLVRRRNVMSLVQKLMVASSIVLLLMRSWSHLGWLLRVSRKVKNKEVTLQLANHCHLTQTKGGKEEEKRAGVMIKILLRR